MLNRAESGSSSPPHQSKFSNIDTLKILSYSNPTNISKGRPLKKKPKIALCANGIRGLELLELILSFDYPIEFVATRDRDSLEHEERIAELCHIRGIKCKRRTNDRQPDFISELKKSNIDIVLLLWWPDIIRKEAIEAVNIGWINQHTSYLPFSQGMHPWYWTRIEGNGAGATLHFIDEGIDTGDVLFQHEIEIDATDTGESLYKKLILCVFDLYKKSFPFIARLEFHPRSQPKAQGTFHLAKEIEEHSRIDLNKTYKAEDLINILRARTFWNGPSSYFYKNGKKYEIRVDITESSS